MDAINDIILKILTWNIKHLLLKTYFDLQSKSKINPIITIEALFIWYTFDIMLA